MSRKKHEASHENHERWLVSYADFITLLFAFFVVMYAMSSINEGKFRVLSESMMAAFRAIDPMAARPIRASSLVGEASNEASAQQVSNLARNLAPDLRPMPTMAIQRASRAVLTITRGTGTAAQIQMESNARFNTTEVIPDPRLAKISAELKEGLEELIRNDLVTVRDHKFWLEVEIKNHVLFESGSAIVNKQAEGTIAEIAAILKEVSNRIQVEGFTDNRPINTPIYPSNWELSAARAANVVNLLTKNGVRPERLSAVGYGEYQPIADNGTEQGRMQNRRVVMVILGNNESRRYPAPSNPNEAKGMGSTSTMPAAGGIPVGGTARPPVAVQKP